MTEEAIQPEDLEGPTVPEPTREEQEIEDRARRQGWRHPYHLRAYVICASHGERECMAGVF